MLHTGGWQLGANSRTRKRGSERQANPGVDLGAVAEAGAMAAEKEVNSKDDSSYVR